MSFQALNIDIFEGNRRNSGRLPEDRRDRHAQGAVQCRHVHTGQVAGTAARRQDARGEYRPSTTLLTLT